MLVTSYDMYNLVTRNASDTLSQRKLTGDNPTNDWKAK